MKEIRLATTPPLSKAMLATTSLHRKAMQEVVSQLQEIEKWDHITDTRTDTMI